MKLISDNDFHNTYVMPKNTACSFVKPFATSCYIYSAFLDNYENHLPIAKTD